VLVSVRMDIQVLIVKSFHLAQLVQMDKLAKITELQHRIQVEVDAFVNAQQAIQVKIVKLSLHARLHRHVRTEVYQLAKVDNALVFV